MPRQTSQSSGLSGTFLDIIVVFVVGHKLYIPFRTPARAINGEAASIIRCQGNRKSAPLSCMVRRLQCDRLFLRIIKSPHPTGGRGPCLCMHRPIVVPPPFAPEKGASTGSTPESKPPRHNGRIPNPATAILPTKTLLVARKKGSPFGSGVSFEMTNGDVLSGHVTL
ncbi:MAG TPA: hypothetical protein VF043_03875 [Ktedonobacteraceae bacterium]